MNMMTCTSLSLSLVIVLVVLLSPSSAAGTAPPSVFPYNPIANPKAIVFGNTHTRFTVLTSRVIRMEYSVTGTFEDRASQAFINRNLPVPVFEVSQSGGWMSITTKYLRLDYLTASTTPFAAENLNVTVSMPAKTTIPIWHPFMRNTGALPGTIKSLDEIETISLNCTQISGVHVHGESLHCAWGVISQSGWTVVNDTHNAFWDESGWPTNTPSSDTQDWYFFGHGREYKDALYDFTLIASQIPLIPRYMSGITTCRWYDFSAFSLQEIVQRYDQSRIPLDTVIIDMDWHITQPVKGDGQNYWTGYTWDPNLFPSPKQNLAQFTSRGLHLGVNLHDAAGVQPHEQMYEPFTVANGEDPSLNKTVPYNVTSKLYMYTLSDIVLKPLMDDGVDFMWIDWQQGGSTGVYINHTNPTFMLNYVRATTHARRQENERGFVVARWGGLGNHRYQVGFSGDVQHSWKSLAFQPYFSQSGTNVGYGFWSNDIIGHLLDYELQTRWVQWGSLSAIFRIHDAGAAAGSCADHGGCTIVEIWDAPSKYFSASRKAMMDRELLIPYLYTLSYTAYLTGLSPIRPMYYDFPWSEEAYTSHSQYMLGDYMLCAPITTPVSSNNNLAMFSVWLPTGVWVERESGLVYNITQVNGVSLSKNWDISEVPVFVRGGAILTTLCADTVYNTPLGNAMKQYTDLVFTIYPGNSVGDTTIYEDDGLSMDYYTNQAFVLTHAIYTRNSAGTTVTIWSEGTYALFPSTRNYAIRVLNCYPPLKVVDMNGTSLPFVYDGNLLALTIDVPNVRTDSKLTVTITPDPLFADAPTLSGISGAIRRAQLAKHNFDEVRVLPNAFPHLSQTAMLGDSLTIIAYTQSHQLFKDMVTEFLATPDGVWSTAVQEVNNVPKIVKGVNATRLNYAVDILAAAFK